MATLTEILVNLMRYQVQLYNNLSDYCLLCALPHRYDRQPLDAIHHHPFRMFQHFHHIPSRDLFFTEAMLMDTINGTIHLRDLPLCVRTSATISAFCINTLADPPELNIIRGLDKHFIHHILLHVIRNHMYIDELISGTNIPLLNVRPDKLLLLRSMKHTLNRATNMVVQHLNEQQRSQFLPRRTPRAFSDIDDAFHDDPRLSDGNTMRTEHYFYPDHLFAIAKEIKSTAAALSLLPDTTTFNLLPRFVHDAFDEVDDLFPGTSLGHRSDQYYRDKLPYLQTEFELVQPYVTDYINSFPTPSTEAKEIASDRACELINVALFNMLSSITAKPIHPDQVNDPDWIPRHTADLRRHPDADLYHVACDPKRIPFSLAVRLIPVYTTGPSGQTIYQAWALPHLNDALRDPELQLFNNFLSYYHTAKENHPEFPFIDLMGSDSPVPNYDHDSEQEPKHIQHTSPDALTSSTRTDFTYPPIEDLTKTLLKYAKNANLRKLSYPTDLQARRRHLTPSLTTFELFATFPRGRAKSLIFGQNKCPIHTLLLALLSTI
ncbi:hypothetical protein MHU86_3464 [Fragilaria crotonensis]|nr:hypothetical protein MHU86_3464 [Fragilaria crotonensis]